MSTMSTAARTLAIMLVAVTGAAACGGGDATGPDDVLQVVNNTNDFSFELDDVPDYSGTLRYQWSNSGTTADIDIEVAASAGIGTITIQDADNAEVFTGDIRQAGSFTSAPGRAGDWIINVILVRVAGPIRFRVIRG